MRHESHRKKASVVIKEKNSLGEILFSKSSDHGATWSEPVSINQYKGNCLDDDYTVEGAVPAVGPNGGPQARRMVSLMCDLLGVMP